MSWGTNEYSGETSANFQSIFTTPSGHAGVTFVAASGDEGAPGIWPASSPSVLSVGGTRLTADATGNYLNETGWSSGGGGPSAFFSRPTYQAGVYSGNRRGSPDVAYDADPVTGFSVYNTYDGGWEQIGGTSAGAPQWVALVAIADQGRMLRGLGSLDGASQTLPALYSLSSADFHDVTGGRNGYSAGTGYDLVTGRGSPRANLVVQDMVGPTTPTTTVVTQAASAVSPAGFVGPKSMARTSVAGQVESPAGKTEADSAAAVSDMPADTKATRSNSDGLIERLRREESERASLLAWLPPVDLSSRPDWFADNGTSTADEAECESLWFAESDAGDFAM
jgi:hypothetical protein